MKIIFLHANSSSAETFNHLELNTAYRSLSILGHDGRIREQYPIEIWKTDLIEQLKDEEEFILVGHSFGGEMALQIIGQLPQLKGLVLVGTPPVKKPLNIEEAYLPYPLIPEFFKEDLEDSIISQIFDDMLVNHSCKEELVQHFKSTDPKMRSSFGHEAANGKLLDDVKTLSEISIPILMINGEQDKLVNQAYLESLQESFAFQNELVPNAGHYPQLENPEEFCKLIEEFIEKI